MATTDETIFSVPSIIITQKPKQEQTLFTFQDKTLITQLDENVYENLESEITKQDLQKPKRRPVSRRIIKGKAFKATSPIKNEYINGQNMRIDIIRPQTAISRQTTNTLYSQNDQSNTMATY